MRTIIAYLNRRGVKDVEAWRTARKLDSLESLKEWCAKNDLDLAMTDSYAASFFSIAPTPPEVVSPRKVAPPKKVSKVTGEVTSATWHVPAAERPLTKAKGKQTKRSRSTPRKTSRSKKGEQ